MDEALFKKEWKGKWVDNFIKIAVDNVTPPYVSIGGKFDLVSHDSNGVEKVKNALMQPSAVNENTHMKISSNGSPSYRISIKAPNYKQAEDELKLAVEIYTFLQSRLVLAFLQPYKKVKLATEINSLTHYTKGTPSLRYPKTSKLRQLVCKRFQVLFHSPLRGSFRLSLTVLVHYRSARSI